jgi:hypothetical protein
MHFLKSAVLALETAETLRRMQADERRCIRVHVAAGIPVDEMCATWIDRHQDEIDRQESGMPLPEPLANHMRSGYGRTGPREAAS